MPKGNIVLIPFPFTDLSGNKLRPALVLAENNLDVTVSFITTQLQWQEPTDILLQAGSKSGIKKTSLVRLSKIATIDRSLIIGVIGSISSAQIIELNVKLKLIFQLP
ncbi:MAG TPA: type II toxin-antitoxin system PemK/MazF family toxin [Mucilaginibacter sp.]|jgi:mRNA interferase MazF|nr:type II toxin-antitoxin system PemK/MazF family toxin [Mucilaginibacter sp.]